MPLRVAFLFGDFLMRVRIDLKTIKLIKTFNPKVDVNALFLPVENIFENREPSFRTKSVGRGKSIKEQYDFIFHYARTSFTGFKILSDTSTYYVIFDGIVISIPHDIEIDYNFSLHSFLIQDFENQSKHLDNIQKASIINVCMAKQHGTSKHAFKGIFLDFFNNKTFTEKNLIVGNNFNRNFVCEFTYAGHKFSFYTYANSNGIFVEYFFPEFKFKKFYPVGSYNIDKFILDFVNEHEYNCKTMKEAVYHIDDFILLRKMTTI